MKSTELFHQLWWKAKENIFSNFSCMFLNPNIFLIWILIVKEAFCYQKMSWPFTVWINCSSDLKNSASNFKSFSRSLEQFFLTVGQNNFGNKIPFLIFLVEWNENLPFWGWTGFWHRLWNLLLVHSTIQLFRDSRS